jgi:hypothetical protein
LKDYFYVNILNIDSDNKSDDDYGYNDDHHYNADESNCNTK